MFGALKLGIAATAGYTLGGRAGQWLACKASKTPSPDLLVGATWGGRVAVFLVTAAILGK